MNRRVRPDLTRAEAEALHAAAQWVAAGGIELRETWDSRTDAAFERAVGKLGAALDGTDRGDRG